MTAFKTVTIQPEVIRAIYEHQKARLAEHYEAIDAFWDRLYRVEKEVWQAKRDDFQMVCDAQAKAGEEHIKKINEWSQKSKWTRGPMPEMDTPMASYSLLCHPGFMAPPVVKHVDHEKMRDEIDAILTACAHGPLELTHEQFLRMQSHERGEPVQKLIDEITEQKKEQA